MRPLVSIGMPVYNGARYLREALDSLLAQDYPNFELIVSDNASEDETEAICRAYAARDGRIRYFRAEENRGAAWNFNHVFERASGPYFMWAAFDDLRHPRCVSKCVEALEANPEAIWCCTGIQFIDENSRPLRDPAVENAAQTTPLGRTRAERLLRLTRTVDWYDLYGLIRSSALRQTRPMQAHWGSDVVLELELCLRGGVIRLEEPLFLYRLFRAKTAGDQVATLEAASNASPPSASWTVFTLEMARTIWRVPLGGGEKCRLTLLFFWSWLVRNRRVRKNVAADIGAELRRTGGLRRRLVLIAMVALIGVCEAGSRVYEKLYWKVHAHNKWMAHCLPPPYRLEG
jgi:glycosyltransferase involved in cell wall biosynthesis